MNANPFEILAEMQTVSPVKARLNAAEKRAQARREGEQKLDEKDILLKLYKGGKRAEIRALMAGEFGKEVRGLIGFMRTMTLSSASALLRVVEDAQWIRHISAHDRDLIESLVFNGIARLREKNDLSWWEDPLPGEPPKVFDEIQAVIRGASA